MTRIGIAVLLALGFMLVGCGSSNSPQTINGNWTATLTGTQSFTFIATLEQGSNPTVTVTNLSLTSAMPCFNSSFAPESATYTSNGIVNGNITGPFSLTITTLFPAQPQNVLTLQGNVNGATIMGTWTMSGGASTGCAAAGSGNFTMNRN
ncbi:MAG TPA: hypothetical protein VJW20_14275 [Candidatus Angelobacter sp.]|nr:hypothetical protein [Candidatus Angelobacter sp.]